MPLERHAHADHGRLRLGEVMGEAGDISGRNAGDTLDVSRGELLGALGELLEADRVSIDPLAVDKAVVDHRGDHAHGEGAVGAGFRHDVPIGLLGGARAVGIDHHDLGAALARFEHEGPMMQIGRDRVARPDHDIFRMDEALGIDAAGRADRQQPCGRGTRGAEGLLVHRRAELVEESVAGGQPLHQPLIAEIRVRHDRLAAVFGDDVLPARGDLGDRLVPGDAGELARALRP